MAKTCLQAAWLALPPVRIVNKFYVERCGEFLIYCMIWSGDDQRFNVFVGLLPDFTRKCTAVFEYGFLFELHMLFWMPQA